MYVLNKIIGCLTNPVAMATLGVMLALLVRLLGRKRVAGCLLIGSVVWIWLWATPFVGRMIGASLERPYLVKGCVPQVEAYPLSDAIELHGGAMGDSSCIKGRGEIQTSADRVWLAGRLWKAGKAPMIYVTGGSVKKTTAGLLEDLGVPTNAVVFAESPRNTEEEAKFISRLFADAKPQSLIPNPSTKPKVLVVTSAWHMKRTMMMYEKYAPNVEAVPAPCDFENTLGASATWTPLELLPNPYALVWNTICLHEWIGILGYKLFR